MTVGRRQKESALAKVCSYSFMILLHAIFCNEVPTLTTGWYNKFPDCTCSGKLFHIVINYSLKGRIFFALRLRHVCRFNYFLFSRISFMIEHSVGGTVLIFFVSNIE